MISIVICSRTQTISSVLRENIKNTIGIKYEIIVIDNSKNQYSIFEAYNIGIEKSKGEYLCFIHDDILFHTPNWGHVVINIFNNDEKIGLIGVAGAKFKSKIPSAWWDCKIEENFTYILQHFKNGEKEIWHYGFDKNAYEEVVVIDGVFMVLKKGCFNKFDSSMTGFHSYDLNISFEIINNNYKIVATNEILIEHFSIGTINKDWLHSTYLLHNKYYKILPLKVGSIFESKELEIFNGEKFIKLCLKQKQSKLATKVWFNLFLLNPFSKFHLRFWFIILKKLGIKVVSFLNV